MSYTITSDCIGCLACLRICPSDAVSGTKKEQHRIDPENCIECGACGRVCPNGSVEDTFGLTVERLPRKEWPRPEVDFQTCMSCNICIDTCPTGALDQDLINGRSLHPVPILLDEKACMGCGFCEDDCPVSAITMVVKAKYPQVEKES